MFEKRKLVSIGLGPPLSPHGHPQHETADGAPLFRNSEFSLSPTENCAPSASARQIGRLAHAHCALDLNRVPFLRLVRPSGNARVRFRWARVSNLGSLAFAARDFGCERLQSLHPKMTKV